MPYTSAHIISRRTSHAAGILFSDLDGTLLRSDHTLSPIDKKTLEDLGKQGIVRVMATGRSLHSFRLVANSDFPADYIIFSTGAGVASLQHFDILKASALKHQEITRTAHILRDAQIDFMLHYSIPHNHTFAFETQGAPNPDFTTRLSMNSQWGHPLEDLGHWMEATQFVAILPPWRDVGIIDEIRAELSDLSIIRATSPFDHQSTWMEIFPRYVSKGTAAAWLCDRLGMLPADSMSIGNDYNDLELLEHTEHSYVVANAPNDLKKRFSTVASNDHNGVSEAIDAWLNARETHD